ncbi:MAG: hypothetical protein A2X59_12555 [Nitrospirae bacterium GWC2_42_7]|nr:MAG: hypothetical protein A2X59_12555 [Nitrospirae bacterium GWC2_42_7]
MKNAIAVLTMLILLSGCSKETARIQDTVIRYNQLLIEGYKSLNMNPLQEVATKEQATKLYYHMAALGEADIRMHSQLKKIDFQGVTFPGSDKAVVMTREVWDFAHMDIRSGEKIYEEKGFIYNVSYELMKDKERWLIEKVVASSDEEESNNKEIYPRLDKPSGKQ